MTHVMSHVYHRRTDLTCNDAYTDRNLCQAYLHCEKFCAVGLCGVRKQRSLTAAHGSRNEYFLRSGRVHQAPRRGVAPPRGLVAQRSRRSPTALCASQTPVVAVSLAPQPATKRPPHPTSKAGKSIIVHVLVIVSNLESHAIHHGAHVPASRALPRWNRFSPSCMWWEVLDFPCQ